MPEPSIGSVPFQEAIDHFRGKLNIPTSRYDVMLGEMHAKAFTVAGAMKLDLLTDIRSAVDQAISSGTTITDFRKLFDEAVQKHGWTYKGKRGWRTRVIFDNNLRTAHMAGRWQQFQRVKETRPFLQYQTAGDRRVRPEHAAWDNQILHIDDSWWDTHMPPNGWGCRCTVRSLSARQMRRDNLDINQAPPLENSQRTNINTGEVLGDVPKGIDTGWNYNVGKTWLAPEARFGEKLVSQPPVVRSQALSNEALIAISKQLMPSYTAWAKNIFKRDTNIGTSTIVGYMSDSILSFATGEGITVKGATIAISDKSIRKMRIGKNRRRGKSLLPEEVLLKIPEHIAEPAAVLWDKKRSVLVYVIDANVGDRTGKLLVEIGFRSKNDITNAVISGGQVPLENLKDVNHYEVIDGKL